MVSRQSRGSCFSVSVRFAVACTDAAEVQEDFPQDLRIWFSQPASKWESESLPLGNGRLGCMVFGGVVDERIQINEDSLWTGDENPSGQYDSMGAYQNLGALRLSLTTSSGKPRPSTRCDSGHAAFYAREEVAQASDGDVTTKWCVEHQGRPVVWTMIIPGDPKHKSNKSLATALLQPMTCRRVIRSRGYWKDRRMARRGWKSTAARTSRNSRNVRPASPSRSRGREPIPVIV